MPAILYVLFLLVATPNGPVADFHVFTTSEACHTAKDNAVKYAIEHSFNEGSIDCHEIHPGKFS